MAITSAQPSKRRPLTPSSGISAIRRTHRFRSSNAGDAEEQGSAQLMGEGSGEMLATDGSSALTFSRVSGKIFLSIFFSLG